jgi:adenylate cyclase
MKMQYYGISEGRVKRIIRFPKRTEEGIVPDTVTVMQPSGAKRYQEIWVMYKLAPQATNNQKQKTYNRNKKIKIITAWRYPGKSPERDPVPKEIIEEVRRLL